VNSYSIKYNIVFNIILTSLKSLLDISLIRKVLIYVLSKLELLKVYIKNLRSLN
jgi:hypothetical protein